jgi:hypothetical protein
MSKKWHDIVRQAKEEEEEEPVRAHKSYYSRMRGL